VEAISSLMVLYFSGLLEFVSVESTEFKQVMEELQNSGLLLESDAVLPSVAGFVAHERIRGSWWGYPRGHDIFQANEQLAAHPDVIACKLISGKVTYVHKTLWLTREEILRTDRLRQSRSAKSKAPREAARELEKRLLVYSEEIHTETGAHAKALETWEHWAKRRGLARPTTTIEQAKEQLEQSLELLNTRFGASGQLPWPATRSTIPDH